MECRTAAVRSALALRPRMQGATRTGTDWKYGGARLAGATQQRWSIQQARLCARVSLIINFFQMIAGNMRINLSCRDIGMAQHFLN